MIPRSSFRRLLYGTALFVCALSLSLAGSGCRSSAPAGERTSPPFTPESPPDFTTDGLRLATLNTEFMYDGSGTEAEFDWSRKGDTTAARKHRARIGTIIRALDADLIMLQEVGNENALELLVQEHLADLGYTAYFVQGRDTFTGQDIGLLARVPIDTVGRTDERARVGLSRQKYGVSKNLFARLQIGSQPVTLIGLHLLARPTATDRKDRREAQAEVIRRLAAAEHEAGRAVVVLGDFNDYDEATPDVNGHRPITTVLATIKRAGPDSDDDLRNALAEVPPADRYTAHWDRDEDGRVERSELSAIDHILLSPTLYPALRAVHYPQFYDPLTYTDHFPIVVTLERK